MPLEIRELVIKASVGSDSARESKSTENGKSSNSHEERINLIVEKVLEILKEKSER